ncbi:MAG: response regulator [Candidatus Gastranaerophilales bacterium]|nr:response regulator [Candidatus Gastranaerophilales bacterium]
MQKKILIVDDTKSWQVFNKEVIFQLYGNLFEITTASSAKEALSIVNKNIESPFDVILTDLQMETSFEPKLAGEWLIEQIRSIPKFDSSKIVIVSAMYNIEIIAKRLNVECISKNLLINNKLLLKFMFEKIKPLLSNID